MTIYFVDIEVHHRLEVEADSIAEAEELAYDDFINERDMWEEVGIYVVEEFNPEEEEEE